MTGQAEKNEAFKAQLISLDPDQVKMLGASCAKLIHEQIRKALEQVSENVLFSFRPGNCTFLFRSATWQFSEK
jgi:hypothetical protein